MYIKLTHSLTDTHTHISHTHKVAAYLLDVDHFAGVPVSTLINCEHPILNYNVGVRKSLPYPKLGSLQEFVHTGNLKSHSL